MCQIGLGGALGFTVSLKPFIEFISQFFAIRDLLEELLLLELALSIVRSMLCLCCSIILDLVQLGTILLSVECDEAGIRFMRAPYHRKLVFT